MLQLNYIWVLMDILRVVIEHNKIKGVRLGYTYYDQCSGNLIIEDSTVTKRLSNWVENNLLSFSLGNDTIKDNKRYNVTLN